MFLSKSLIIGQFTVIISKLTAQYIRPSQETAYANTILKHNLYYDENWEAALIFNSYW